MSQAREQPMDNGNELSRRDCLLWLARAGAASLVAGSGIGRCFAEDQPGGMVKIADLINIRNAMAYEIEKPNLILTRTNDGVACMSITCTHRRSKLDVDKDGAISCPMHGSTYDLTGKPTGGPATNALTWYQTDVDKDGRISTDASKTVKQGQWAALPDWAKKK